MPMIVNTNIEMKKNYEYNDGDDDNDDKGEDDGNDGDYH